MENMEKDDLFILCLIASFLNGLFVIIAIVTNPVNSTYPTNITYQIMPSVEWAKNIDKTLDTVATLELNDTQVEVHRKLGVPDYTLSGVLGDVYVIEGTKVIIHYIANDVEGLLVSEVKIISLENL